MTALLIVGGLALTSFAFVAGCMWNAAHGAHFADQDRVDAELLEVRLRETQESEARQSGEVRRLTVALHNARGDRADLADALKHALEKLDRARLANDALRGGQVLAALESDGQQ